MPEQWFREQGTIAGEPGAIVKLWQEPGTGKNNQTGMLLAGDDVRTEKRRQMGGQDWYFVISQAPKEGQRGWVPASSIDLS